MNRVRAFAPASIANVGSGFDVVGLALDGPGDEVEVEFTSEFKGVRLVEIVNDPGLPMGPDNVVQAVGQKLYDSLYPNGHQYGVKVTLYKNMKIGTGMGSSASSGAAVIAALLELFSNPVQRNSKEVLQAAVYGEQIASGSPHPDNVLPSLLGGALVIYDDKTFKYHRFEGDGSIYFAVVSPPDLRSDTQEMREALKKAYGSMDNLVAATRRLLGDRGVEQERNYDLSGYDLSGLVRGVSPETMAKYLTGSLEVMYGLRSNDTYLLGQGVLKDDIVTPVRAGHIKGYGDVKNAAMQENALGFSLSGSGPAAFAVVPSEGAAYTAGEAMVRAWERHGVKSKLYVSPINNAGARIRE